MHEKDSAYFSLFEFNNLIKQALALNFNQPLWVRCEIGQLKESRGHRYISLVEKDTYSEQIVARADAVIWKGEYNRMYYKLGDFLSELIREGMQVLLSVEVDYHVQYGLKFIIKDVDPSYTLGALSRQREEVIRKLMDGGLMDLNKTQALPSVIQRIAIISSAEAAGYKDFINHLYKNQYGYQFLTNLYQAAMQGERTTADVLQCLQEISAKKHRYDCIVFIRGGGSKLDLSWFDDYRLCETLAMSPLPVITGIGHETDQSVADMVAHTALKTPTAVADFIVENNSRFEEKVKFTVQKINALASTNLHKTGLRFNRLKNSLNQLAIQLISNSRYQVRTDMSRITENANYHIRQKQQELKHVNNLINLVDPVLVLKKGYVMVQQNGKLITSKKAFLPEASFELQWHDGVQPIKPENS